MSITHIFWDWNGTLIDDASFCVSILNKLLAGNNKEQIDLEYYRSKFCFPVSKFYRTISLGALSSEFDKISNVFIQNYRKSWFKCSLQPFSKEVLETLNRNGISQSILSAGMQKDVESFIKYHDLNRYFSIICGTKDIRADGKLSFGLHLMKTLQLNPSEILLVGDTIHDYEVATYLGCKTLLFTGGHNDKTVLTACKCNIIDSLTDVLDFVLH
jgi:phosphoglycolate phosphatase